MGAELPSPWMHRCVIAMAKRAKKKCGSGCCGAGMMFEIATSGPGSRGQAGGKSQRCRDVGARAGISESFHRGGGCMILIK